MKPSELAAKIENVKTRSAWDRGVIAYTLDLIEELPEEELPQSRALLEKMLLNGAQSWDQYSWSGCSLIYDSQIAARLCSPSELKKTRNGERHPNSREEWLDTQARALYQASRLVLSYM